MSKASTRLILVPDVAHIPIWDTKDMRAHKYTHVHTRINKHTHTNMQTHTHRSIYTTFTWLWPWPKPAVLSKCLFQRWKTSAIEGQSDSLYSSALNRATGTFCIQLKWHCLWEWVQSDRLIMLDSTVIEWDNAVSRSSDAFRQINYMRLNSVLRWNTLVGKSSKQNQVVPVEKNPLWTDIDISKRERGGGTSN